MKYNINLNLIKMQEHNLNVNQWCILDIISTASTWCDIITYKENHYYWISKNKICEELKALDLKVDTIYRHLKTLKDLGFIEYEKDNKKDLVILTSLGKSLFFKDENSEINPTKLGNKSDKNSEINPTYNNTSIYNNTNNKEKNIKKENQKTKKDLVIQILKDIDLNLVNKKALNEWLEFKSWNYKKVGITKLVNMLSKFNFDIQQEIVDKSIMNNYQGLFEPKNINNKPQHKTKDQLRNEDIDAYFAMKNQNSYDDIIETEIL